MWEPYNDMVKFQTPSERAVRRCLKILIQRCEIPQFQTPSERAVRRWLII